MASKVSFTICSFVLPYVEIMNINFFAIKISFLPSGKKDFFGYILSAVGGLGLAPCLAIGCWQVIGLDPFLLRLKLRRTLHSLDDGGRCTLDIKLLTSLFYHLLP